MSLSIKVIFLLVVFYFRHTYTKTSQIIKYVSSSHSGFLEGLKKAVNSCCYWILELWYMTRQAGTGPTVVWFKQWLNNTFYSVTGGFVFTKGEITVDGYLDVLESYKTIQIMLIVPKPLPNWANAARISLFLHFSPEIMQLYKTVVTRCQFHTVLYHLIRIKFKNYRCAFNYSSRLTLF